MEQNDRAHCVEEIVRHIDEIKARCDRATPGAWRDVERGNSVISHGVVTVAYDGLPQQNVCAGISPKTGNATFIAHAREDIPYLLQLVEAQSAEIAELRRRVDTKETLLRLQETTMSMLSSDKDTLIHRLHELEAQLSASQQETRAAVEAEYEFVGEMNVYPNDAEPDEEHIASVCVVRCKKCGWHMFGDGWWEAEHGNFSKSEQIPQRCGHCGAKFVDDIGPQEESFISKTIDGVETAVIIRRGPQEAGEEQIC